jgi:hypothetical protein
MSKVIVNHESREQAASEQAADVRSQKKKYLELLCKRASELFSQ